MKKLFKIFTLALVGVFALASCEDVPAPYPIPGTGEGGDNQTPEATEVTCAQAVELCNALADGATSTETYTITGYITDVFNNISNNQQSFWISDENDGQKLIQAYWANLPEGVSTFTKGSKVKITGNLYKFVKNDGSIVPEVKNADVEILEGEGSETPVESIEVTCAKAVELCNALADGASSTEVYNITGYITEIIGSVSRNQQSFWIADTQDGGKMIQAYWANLPEGVEAFTQGSKVKITGNLMKYIDKNGSIVPEIKNANVEILEKGEGGNTGDEDKPGEGEGEGTVLTSLVNGGFEEWVNDAEPEGWKSASTASNATLSKSTDARTGNYAVSVAGYKLQNKRLASQEITLEAGTYKFSFYAKSTTGDICQTRGGYVPVKNGAVGSYTYNKEWSDLTNTEWTLVEYEFTLSTETTVCLLMMNPKETANHSISQNILVDDATLVKK